MTPKATRETVLAARQQLLSAGKKVTWRAIESITGGSQSTIGRLLREIEEEESRKPSSPKVKECLDVIWAEAIAAAERRLGEQALETEKRLTENLARLEELEALVDKASQERDRAVAQREELLASLTSAGAEADRLRLVAKEESDRARQAASLVNQVREEMAAAAAKAADELRSAEIRAAASSQRLSEAELEAVRTKATLDQKLARAEADIAAAKSLIEDLRAREGALQQEISSTRKQADQDRARLEDIRADGQARLDKVHDQLSKALAEKEALVRDSSTQIMSLQARIALLERELAESKDQTKKTAP